MARSGDVVVNTVAGEGSPVTVAAPTSFYDNGDLRVYRTSGGAETLLSEGVQYSVVKSAVPGSKPTVFAGSITTLDAIPATDNISILVQPANEQTTTFRSRPFNPADIEHSFDRASLVQAAQEMWQRLGVRQPITDLANGPLIMRRPTGDGQIPVWDHAAGLFVGREVTFVEQLGAQAYDAIFGPSLVQFPQNKSLEFRSTGESIVGLLSLRNMQDGGRASLVFRDFNAKMRAAVSWHGLHTNGERHDQLEIKTDSQNDGMSTRLAISSGQDAAEVQFNNLNYVNFLRRDPAATNSSHRIFVRLNSDPTGPTIDVNPNVHTEGGLHFSGNRFAVRYNGSSYGEVFAGQGKGLRFFADSDLDDPAFDPVADHTFSIDNDRKARFNQPVKLHNVSRSEASAMLTASHLTKFDRLYIRDTDASVAVWNGVVDLNAAGTDAITVFFDGANLRYC